MVNLLVDIGNSNCKVAFHKNGELFNVTKNVDATLDFILSVIKDEEINVIVLSNVRDDDPAMYSALEERCNRLIVLDSETKLPLELKYNFPHETLGADRRAAALAVAMIFPGKDCIKFDFGTALTIDYIDNDGTYSGGNISLGMQSRFRALNTFTKRLPLITPDNEFPNIGVTISGAMTAGVVLGLIFEVEGYINQKPNNTVILTGGDAAYFAKKIKKSTFVIPNLVLLGLAQIAEFYADDKKN